MENRSEVDGSRGGEIEERVRSVQVIVSDVLMSAMSTTTTVDPTYHDELTFVAKALGTALSSMVAAAAMS